MCLAKWLGQYKAYALLPVRFVLAVVFLYHGYGKLFGGLDGFAGMLTGLGVPAASLMAVVVACVEFFGGLLMLLGLFTRYVAVLQTAVMVVAVATVHWSKGFNLQGGWEYNFVLIGGLLAMLLAGPGMWSLEQKLFKREV